MSYYGTTENKRGFSFWMKRPCRIPFLFMVFFSAATLLCFAQTTNESQFSGTQAEDGTKPSGQTQQNLTILSLRVQGNQIVSTSTILGKIATREGTQLFQETVNEDIKRLYGTGFFRDIRFDVDPKPDGVHVILVVEEKPVVRAITVQGNRTFDERKLRKEVKILEGQVLDERLVVEGVRAIEKKYLDKGFRFVKVTYRIDVSDLLKEANVVIQVEEGEAYRIKAIDFLGVKSFRTRQIRKLLKTKPRNLLFFRRGVFSESDFRNDIERIMVFYQDEGFLDVKASPDFEYDEKSKKIVISVSIEESVRYQTGEVLVEGNKIFPENEIWQRLGMLPGTTYSQKYLMLDMDNVRKFYFSRGYVDVRIVPNIRYNRESSRVDVSYTIEEGDLYFVEKVKVRGNSKTKDIVIRRELRIYPGNKMDGSLLDKSKQRLENLGFFEEVTYDTEPGSKPNQKDIVFRVKEKQTGELSFGGGYSSVDQFMGFAEISQKNFDLFNWPRFTGRGQHIALRGRIGSISKNVEFSFLEPYFLDRKISLGFDAYNTRFESRNVDFAHERRGAGLTFGHPFSDILKAGFGYTFERVKVYDIQDSAAKIVRDSEGSNLLSRLKLFLTRDSTDSVYNPTKGSVLGVSSELVGTFLGGDADYYILQANAIKYWAVGKKSVLEWRNRVATADALGSTNEVPIFDRFYAGGLGTIRGYNYRRVSPKEDNRPIGGETLFITSMEYTFPLPYLESFKGSCFTDIGQVSRDSYDFSEFGDFIVSIGPGIKVNTPIGPLAFYYGFPIFNQDTEDKNGRFEFSLSRSF